MTGGGMGATTRPLFPRAPRATGFFFDCGCFDCFGVRGAAFVGATRFAAAVRGLPLAPVRFLTGAGAAAVDDALRFVGAATGAAGAGCRPSTGAEGGATASAFRPFLAVAGPLEGSFAATCATARSAIAAVRDDAVAPPGRAPRPADRRLCPVPLSTSLTRSLICSNMQRT
jgi:hypothetical protein